MEFLASIHLSPGNIIFVAAEMAVLAFLYFSLRLLLRLILVRLPRVLPFLRRHEDKLPVVRAYAGKVLGLLFVMVAAVLFIGSVYVMVIEGDLLAYSRFWLDQMPEDFWTHFFIALVKAVVFFVAAPFVVKGIERLLEILKTKVKSYEHIQANEESIDRFFVLLNRIQVVSVWLIACIFASLFLPLPETVPEYLTIALKIFIIVSVGLLLVQAVDAVVDSLDALSKKYWYRDDYLVWYERMEVLVPLLRRCLEYIVYAVVATLVIMQVNFVAEFARYGPAIAQIIGIFFLARVVVEICNLLVDQGMLREVEDLPESELQQRRTLAPIMKSLLKYVVFFGALVLMMRALDINPLPLMAGAGVFGVVIGLGAQPLINDIVSGFFILFENLFLVGDYVEIGTASGVVEAVEVRTTRIRSRNGQLHILRNGQIGEVVNFSKEYTFSVVEVGVAYDSDLDKVYAVLQEAGGLLKEQADDVLAPTVVEGLKNFGESELLIRTTTKVRPGTHKKVALVFRKLIKEAFDRQGIEIPFARRVVIFKNDSNKKDEPAPQPLVPGLD